MKLRLLLLFSFFMSLAQAATVYYHIEVTNPTHNNVVFIFKEKPGDSKAQVYSINLKEGGKVDMALRIEESTIVELEYGDKNTRIYATTTDDMTIRFDANSFPNDIQFSGKGAQNNTYFTQFQSQKPQSVYPVERNYLHLEFPSDVYEKAQKSQASSFVEWIDGKKRKALNELTAAKSKGGMNQAVYQYIRDDISYQAAIDKMSYLLINEQVFGASEAARFDEYYRPLSGVYEQKEQLINHPTYQAYLDVYANYLGMTKMPQANDEFGIYKKVNQFFKGRSKYYMLSRLMLVTFEKTGKTHLGERFYVDFQKDNPYPEYLAPIKQFYAGTVTLLENVEAPNINLKTLDGKTLRLSDYRGKVVYISFWASWCKPCIKGFQKSEALRKELAANGIILLNVSIDQTEDLWRTAYEKHQPFGTNVWSTNLDQVRKDYELRSIPAYFILDKNGKFAYLSDDTDRNILDEFKRIQRQ